MDNIIDIETSGLMDNLFERVLCICVYNIDEDENISFSGIDEKKILLDFFDYIYKQKKPRLIGFSSSTFDIPFIIRRCVIHKVKTPRFDSLDLRKIVNGFFYSYNPREKGSLRDWATAFGMTVSTSPGSEMFKLYKEKKFDEIVSHCTEDIKITFRLYEHAKACGLV